MKPFALALITLVTSAPALADAGAPVRDYNAYVLEAVSSLPEGGVYSKLDDATIALGKSIWLKDGLLRHDANLAKPVYCSGASYEAFITVIARLQKEGAIRLTDDAMKGVLVAMQPDGHDTWGRWNANGPGTSRLFFELGLGMNTMSWNDARPGDFMKIFFNEHIGKLERGHSVVYLGSLVKDGVEYFRYWSSDAPAGRGTHEIPKSRAIRVIFSRLQYPEKLNDIPRMPKIDPYTASLLTHESSLEEMKEKIGL